MTLAWQPHRFPRNALRSFIQGRVGAPSLTHLRGKAAFVSSRDAAGAAEIWDADGAASLPRLTKRAAARKPLEGQPPACPKTEWLATTPPRSHHAARRNLIDVRTLLCACTARPPLHPAETPLRG